MHDSVHTAFDEAMRREKKTVYDYYSNQPRDCFFRRNLDRNQLDDNLTIFYYADAPIERGKLINFGGRTFLTLNQETAENTYYRRSDLIETNMTLETFANGYDVVVPCFAGDITDPNLNKTSVVASVGGSIHLITEKNSVTDSIQIDAKFVAMGGTYQIVNLYDKGGIKHIFVERTQSSDNELTYTLTISGADTGAVGSSAQYAAVAKVSDTDVLNATIRWSSSNYVVATVDATGAVTFHSNGTVTITAYWVEHDLTATKEITAGVATPLVCTISGNDEIELGANAAYTATFYDSHNNVVGGITPTWGLTLSAAQEGNIAIASQSGNTVTVSAANVGSLEGTSFTLNLAATGYSATKTISLISAGGGWW